MNKRVGFRTLTILCWRRCAGVAFHGEEKLSRSNSQDNPRATRLLKKYDYFLIPVDCISELKCMNGEALAKVFAPLILGYYCISTGSDKKI